MSSAAVIPDLSRLGYEKIGAGADIYNAVVNWSTLKLMDRSPAHYAYALEQGGDTEDTDARLLGRATHVATLEPAIFETSFNIWKGGRRDPRQEDYRDFLATSILQGRDVLTVEQRKRALQISKSARSHPPALAYLPGRRELTITFPFIRQPMLGLDGYSIACKGRIDLVCDNGALLDLKSTRDASPEGFTKDIARYGYHLQAALYRHGFQIASGERRARPYFLLAVESRPPFVPQLYQLGDPVLEHGHGRVLELFDRLDYCRRSKHWGGYFDGSMSIEELPRWEMPRDDEDFA